MKKLISQFCLKAQILGGYCASFFYKKKIKSCAVLILLISFSSCRYYDHDVQISSHAPQLQQSKFEDSDRNKVAIRVFDSRKQKKFIGFRTRASIWTFKEKYKDPNFFSKQDGVFKVARINSKEGFIDVLEKKLFQNLLQKNLEIRNFSANLLKVEILELGLVSTMYRNFLNSKIKVTMSSRYKNFSKIYDQKMVSYKPMVGALLFGPLDFGTKGKYYDRLINECLDKNIAQIMLDDEIWSRV
jgi:hypothetical protein